ncbi:hypothetical protein NDU88_011493 [Pleurodeles waltl]|uniref:Uncharacterized protein n=1 Tax=Pleurodeles waltl TaxID=8319 RepID=A0AAV7R0I0_PLEWA|nr:hypothetical protein NDU88_011493 [Pleurodeles waltl]
MITTKTGVGVPGESFQNLDDQDQKERKDQDKEDREATGVKKKKKNKTRRTKDIKSESVFNWQTEKEEFNHYSINTQKEQAWRNITQISWIKTDPAKTQGKRPDEEQGRNCISCRIGQVSQRTLFAAQDWDRSTLSLQRDIHTWTIGSASTAVSGSGAGARRAVPGEQLPGFEGLKAKNASAPFIVARRVPP